MKNFFSLQNKRPFIAIKTATTLDGKIAAQDNSSKWITSDDARQYVHKLRSEYQGILTGSNTVLKDNPSLNVRDIKGKNPVRIILDREFKTNFDFNVYKNDGTRVILITNKKVNAPKHIEIINFKDFNTLFKNLYEMGICSLMVEAGSGLNSEIIKAKEADYFHYFMAPKILGDGLDFVKGFEISDINKSINLEIDGIKKFSKDILINYKFKNNSIF